MVSFYVDKNDDCFYDICCLCFLPIRPLFNGLEDPPLLPPLLFLLCLLFILESWYVSSESLDPWAPLALSSMDMNRIGDSADVESIVVFGLGFDALKMSYLYDSKVPGSKKLSWSYLIET